MTFRAVALGLGAALLALAAALEDGALVGRNHVGVNVELVLAEDVAVDRLGLGAAAEGAQCLPHRFHLVVAHAVGGAYTVALFPTWHVLFSGWLRLAWVGDCFRHRIPF